MYFLIKHQFFLKLVNLLTLGRWFKNTSFLFCFFFSNLSPLTFFHTVPFDFWQDFDNLNNQMSWACEPALKLGYTKSGSKSF